MYKAMIPDDIGIHQSVASWLVIHGRAAMIPVHDIFEYMYLLTTGRSTVPVNTGTGKQLVYIFVCMYYQVVSLPGTWYSEYIRYHVLPVYR